MLLIINKIPLFDKAYHNSRMVYPYRYTTQNLMHNVCAIET